MEGKNESKHTPGPWFILPDNSTVVVANYLDPFDNKLKALSIADTSKDQSKTLTERNANAELIASAPALLEENENLKWKCSIWEPKINELTEEVDVWRKKADAEEVDAKKWYKKYNEMSAIAFDLRAEVDRLTKEKSELRETLMYAREKLFGYYPWVDPQIESLLTLIK